MGDGWRLNEGSDAAALIDDDFDYGLDAPLSILQSERRIHVRAYNRWTRLRGDRAFPHPDHLASPELAEFLPRAVILRYPEGQPSDPELLFIGRALRDEAGLEDGAHPSLDEIPEGSLAERLAARHRDIASHRAPVGVEAEFRGAYGEATLYRGVMLPFSADGQAIDHVCGIVNWKLAAPSDVTADMQAAVEQVRSAPMARSAPPFPMSADERDRAYLRDRPALAEARMAIPGEDEFVLLVARRQPDGTLAVIATLPADETVLAEAARRI